ncbi:MAG: hypothetical protein IJ662_11595 [Clostridia bacterium]|nr:hypothetical protein [Clostridia bacterium]
MDTLRLPSPKPRMIAHRGMSGLEMENTCSAFVAAGNRTHFGIETDVHRTLDGQFVIIHDDDTLRVSGDKMIVEETSLETLRSLRLKDRDGQRGRRDLMLPTLQEYIQICKKYEKTAVLELKNHFDQADIERIIAIIQAEDYLPRTMFISFDLPNMICVRSLLPQQKAQYLIECAVPDDLIDTLKRYRLDLDIDHHLLTKPLADACKRAGIEINVWTVNTLQDAQRVIDLGVDYITSNILE